MGRICVVCDKCPRTANRVSNANNKTTRWLYPNTHVMRFSYAGQRTVERGAVCTKCVKAGKVQKVV